MVPFTLHCTTCQRTLRVTDAAAIGQILPCPKCASMVHVVPPLAADARSGESELAARTVASSTAVASSQPSEDEFEQFAVEGAAIVSDDSATRPGAPPPLPAEYSAKPVDAIARVAKPGVFIAAGAVAVLAAVGMAWGIWWYLQDDPVPSVAETFDTPAKFEQKQSPRSPHLPDDVQASQSPGAPVAESDEPQTAASQPATSKRRPAVVNPSGEPIGFGSAPAVEPADDRQANNSDSTADDRKSPLEKSATPGNSAAADARASDERSVRKPAIKLDELPNWEIPTADPVVAKSAGQEAAEAATITPQRDPSEHTDPEDHRPTVEAPAKLAEPPLRRIAPNRIDVPARLATPIDAIQFRDAPLHKAAETFSDLAGVPIGIEVDALRAAGVRIDQPLTLVAKSATIGGALEQGLRPLGLVAREQSGCLTILPAGAGQARKARYAVDDLLRPGDPPIEDLVEIVRNVVAPRAIAGEGHSPAVSAENGTIYLTAREIEHDRMIELCEKLRVARGRPLRTRFDANRPDARFDPRRFELATRRTKAQGLLAKRVTAGIGRGAPLCDVVEFLAEQTGATILIDQAALAAESLAAQTEARLVAAGEPLETVLGRLLEPHGLACRVVDGKVLEITTANAAAQRLCIEFYPVRGLAGYDVGSYREKLLAAAGIEGSKAAIEFDPPSECLIVSAAYREHVLLEQAVRKLVRP